MVLQLFAEEALFMQKLGDDFCLFSFLSAAPKALRLLVFLAMQELQIGRWAKIIFLVQ